MDTSTPRSPAVVADNVAAFPEPEDDRIAREVLKLKLSGAEGEQRYSISNPRRCTCVQSPRLVYTVPLITEIDQITVLSHSVQILTYCYILIFWIIFQKKRFSQKHSSSSYYVKQVKSCFSINYLFKDMIFSGYLVWTILARQLELDCYVR